MPVPPRGNFAPRILLRDQVQERLQQAILDGTLLPGERLRDEDLIAWLNVSRTPIREALGALAKTGLVEMVPNRYTRVALPKRDGAFHAVRALGVLLGGIVRITLPELTTAQREGVAERVSTLLEQLRAGGTRAIVHSVDDSYRAWLELCPNPALTDVARQAAQGLAFAYRVDDIDELIPAAPLIARLTSFRGAVLDGDAERAGVAIEAAHMLPRQARTAATPCECRSSHPYRGGQTSAAGDPRAIREKI